MIVTGKRLILRTVREADLDALYALACNIEASGMHYPVSILSETDYKRAFQQNGFWSDDRGQALVCDLENRLLGEMLYFKTTPYYDGLEVGYRLFDTRQSNRGFMTEALTLFTYVLFVSRKIQRIELKIMPQNVPSKRVAEKAGYKFEGVARQAMYHRGTYQDLEVYSILRREAPATLEEALARIYVGEVPLKQRLLELLHQAHTGEQRFLMELGDSERAAIGTPERWAPKDLIAHFTFWQDLLGRTMAAVERGEPPPERGQTDALNARTFQKNRERPWRDLWAEAQSVFAGFVAQVSRCTEEQLLGPKPFAWFNDLPLIGTLVRNSYLHPLHHLVTFYSERGDLAHARQIEEMVVDGLRKLGVLPELRGDALLNLARLYAATGERSKAVDSLHEALSVEPELREAVGQDPALAPLRA